MSSLPAVSAYITATVPLPLMVALVGGDPYDVAMAGLIAGVCTFFALLVIGGHSDR